MINGTYYITCKRALSQHHLRTVVKIVFPDIGHVKISWHECLPYRFCKTPYKVFSA